MYNYSALCDKYDDGTCGLTQQKCPFYQLPEDLKRKGLISCLLRRDSCLEGEEGLEVAVMQ